jgi:amino acid transporter
MYILMFAAAIKLRYSKPNVKRAYNVPGGRRGMWVVAGLGIAASIFAIATGFLPPSQASGESLLFYEGFLVAGIVLVVVAPFVIYYFKKPSWVPRR